MASFSLTVEDSSPLFVYDPPGAWSDSSPDDPLLPSYSGQSYHTTSQQGATATVEFYGTGITILGGKRPQYGAFMVSVDNTMVVSGGSAKGESNATRQTLATISGLPPGKHRAVIESAGGSPIDIDSIVIIDQVGSAGSEMEARNIEDSDPALSYAPSPAAWGQNQLDMFRGGTIRFSQNPNAAVSLPFEGEAIAIYGTASPDHADMKVTLNGETSILKGGSNGGVNRLHPQVLLYYRSGLGGGTHNLNFAVDSPNPNSPFIDLDSITIFSASNGVSVATSSARRPTEAATTVKASPTGISSGSKSGDADGDGLKMSKGALAGIIVGAIAVLLVCLALFLAWKARRRRMSRSDGEKGPEPMSTQEKNNGMLSSLGLFRRSDSPVSPDLPMQQEPRIQGMAISAPLENSVFVFPPRPTFTSIPAKRAADARHSIAPSYYGSPESGRAHMSVGSSSSETPLIRPPAGRTVPAKAFRTPPFPVAPVPPLPFHSPSMSTASSRDGAYSARSSPRPRNPPSDFEPGTPHTRSASSTSPSARYSTSSVRSPRRPIRLIDKI